MKKQQFLKNNINTIFIYKLYMLFLYYKYFLIIFMNKNSINHLTLILATICSFNVIAAEYQARYPFEPSSSYTKPNEWKTIEPLYTDWNITNNLYNCQNWLPLPTDFTESNTFTQNGLCSTGENRTRQEREQEENTNKIRNVGEPIVETRILSSQTATREYTIKIDDWIGQAKTNCTNWSPDPYTVKINDTYKQTATDCTQVQTRQRNESYVDHNNKNTIVLPTITETKQLTAVSNERDSIGKRGIANQPLGKVPTSSQIGTVSNGQVSSNGVQGFLIYGPYDKNIRSGSYTLTLYGTTQNIVKSYIDTTIDGGATMLTQNMLPSNKNGVILSTNISMPSTVSTQYGLEVRVFAFSNELITVTGWTLLPNN